MCKMLKVSKSGYYDWLDRAPSKRWLENEALTMAIHGIQGQLWELRGAKDPGGALEKGISGLKAQGGQDNEGQLVLTLTNGQEVTGLLEEENDEALILRTSDAEPLEVAHSRIKTRRNLPSGMPAMGKIISKRELRDLIEYLSNLKTTE